MSATVISFGVHGKAASPSGKKKGSEFTEPMLPFDPTNFAGRVMFWPESRLDDPLFDKALRFEGVQTIFDLRDAPTLGGLRSLHHLRCHTLDRWDIGYFRLGPLIAKAERAAMLPFEVTRSFAAMLNAEVPLINALRDRPGLGAVLVIYPDQTARIDSFLGACRAIGLSAFDTLPFRR